jgi:hypothetical protein
MKGLLQWGLLLMLVAGLRAAPLWAEEQSAPPRQNQTSDQGSVNGKGAGTDLAAAVSSQQEIVGKMLDAMREMARMMRAEAKDPERQAEAAEMVEQIDQLKDQHQLMFLAMNMPAKPPK